MQSESPRRCVVRMPVHGRSVRKLEFVRDWPSLNAKRWTEAFVEATCSDPSLAAVVLLGSAVRSVKQVNDIDILYIFKHKEITCPRRPIDIDLRKYSQEEVRCLLAEGNDLLGWALHFGHLICERERYWASLRKEWLKKLPLPDPEVAMGRARKAGELYRTFREMGDVDAAQEQLLTQLTHEARALLLSKGIYPKSRPELPEQLSSIAEHELAHSLSQALSERAAAETPSP